MKEAHALFLGTTDRELRLYAGDATHQHYKGGLYRLVGELKDADTGATVFGKDGHPRVIYQHCAPYVKEYWVRDYSEFFGVVATPQDHPDFGKSAVIPRFRALS